MELMREPLAKWPGKPEETGKKEPNARTKTARQKNTAACACKAKNDAAADHTYTCKAEQVCDVTAKTAETACKGVITDFVVKPEITTTRELSGPVVFEFKTSAKIAVGAIIKVTIPTSRSPSDFAVANTASSLDVTAVGLDGTFAVKKKTAEGFTIQRTGAQTQREASSDSVKLIVKENWITNGAAGTSGKFTLTIDDESGESLGVQIYAVCEKSEAASTDGCNCKTTQSKTFTCSEGLKCDENGANADLACKSSAVTWIGMVTPAVVVTTMVVVGAAVVAWWYLRH